MNSFFDWVKRTACDSAFPARLIAGLCALFGLFFLPLAYRNGFFDINRFKVELVVRAVPVFAAAMAVFGVYARRRAHAPVDRAMKCVFAALGCFAAACVVSAAMRGFEQAVLDGSEGRYSGMVFLLCCAALFFVIAPGRLSGEWIAALAMLAAALAALLGVANVYGLDPLGFYARMLPQQIHQFLSTIGNVDFYGAYLALILPLAGGYYALCGDRLRRWLGLVCALAIILGIPASRSDSTYFTMHLALIVLLALCGESYLSMMRASILCACAWGALPLMGQLLVSGSWEYRLFGILHWFCESRAAYGLCALFIAAAAAFAALHARHAKPVGRRRLVRWLIALLLTCAVILVALNVHYTVIAPDQDIGLLSQILRFDDHWGTRRGFVYLRSMRALADYSPVEILFGKGVDLTKRILNPYFDSAEITRLGVFNDAHCQPLQFLLTIGLTGSVALMAFHVLLMIQLYKKGFHDTLSLSCLCALAAYVPVAMLHVAQPILLSTYFAVAALGASRLMYLRQKEGNT